MVLSWQNIITVVSLWCLIFVDKIISYPSNWQPVETLAEDHPYIVGLLNAQMRYACTGVTITQRTVLTSADCVNPQPHFIAVATAVLSEDMPLRSIFEVASAKQHSDYTLDIRPTEPNSTLVHSNIGLVFAVQPALDNFLETAEIGNYFTSELKTKRLTVVSYGELYSGTIVLQQKQYHQVPCTNPKWYYCVCGIEYSDYSNTHNTQFGKGAPVLLGSKVVGIAATPGGLLSVPAVAVKYNIFTIIAPYVEWISKTHHQSKKSVKFRAAVNGSYSRAEMFIKCVLILFLIIQLIN